MDAKPRHHPLTTLVESVDTYLGSHPEPKRADLYKLHERFVNLFPGSPVSYFDGLDDTGKVVANPTLGYGKHTLEYATGASKEVFKLGLSANKSGISLYLMGIKDKTLLKSMFQDRLGKAKVTGYCIRFGKLADIDADILMDVIANVI
jgi:hypothetical protein